MSLCGMTNPVVYQKRCTEFGQVLLEPGAPNNPEFKRGLQPRFGVSGTVRVGRVCLFSGLDIVQEQVPHRFAGGDLPRWYEGNNQPLEKRLTTVAPQPPEIVTSENSE